MDALNDAIDGLADVLTAESIFQAVRGNTTATAASLDSMAAGVLPPMPEVTRTPLSGNSFTQRLAVALAPGTPPADDWGTATPRALAEPALDHWIGTLLGAPISDRLPRRLPRPKQPRPHPRRTSRCDRSTSSPSPEPSRPASEIANSTNASSPPSLRQPAPRSTTTRPRSSGAWPTRSSSPARSAHYSRSPAHSHRPTCFLRRTRQPPRSTNPPPPKPRPARKPQSTSSATTTATLDQALTTTAGAAATATTAQLTALRAALQQAAAYGIPGAYPATDDDGPTLITLATWVKTELAKRQPASLPPAGSDPSALLAAASAAAQTIFGRDFLFLPQLTTNNVATPLAASASLLGDSNGPEKAVQQLSRVRTNLGCWRSLWMYAQAFGATAPTLEVVQLPEAQTWAGNPGPEIAGGTLSLIVHRPSNAAPVDGWAGIVIDEWTEVVPATNQGTALSFRYESPVAEPPQAILLAVPPTGVPTWDHDTLLDTVRETLLLAKVRTVDCSLLGGLRPFLPAICLTGNTANETVSTDFLPTIVAEPELRLA